ncbi:MAG: hypothetical protein J7L38_05995 [Thermoproteales archaeon]|nr:hypothetical protein [Thermoproteales archaeon]
MVFVVIISRLNILVYPFNWIYLRVSPIIIFVRIAGARKLHASKIKQRNM